MSVAVNYFFRSKLSSLLLTVFWATTFVAARSGSAHAAEALPNGHAPTVAAGYGDVMDRLIKEFKGTLAKEKMLVVWVIGQSEGMQDDRDEIMARFDRVYYDLGISSADKRDSLLIAVVSYGEKVVNHTPQPSADPAKYAAAFKEISVDPSGVEMQNQALQFAAETFAKFAQQDNRQLTIILVADECGDAKSNLAQTEQTIAGCRRLKAKVCVLGREAVFGYPYAHVRSSDPLTRFPQWLPIDCGPETAYPEQLQINGFCRRTDMLPAGFGPYDQSRIARETGGTFFLLPSPEVQFVGRRLDIPRIDNADRMRPYAPDLSSRDVYVKERDASPLRKAVYQIVADLDPQMPGNKGAERELKTDQFSIDRAIFAKQAEVEMKKSAALIKYYQEARKTLESVKPLREQETSPRWRANYDLLYAQTIAYPVRLQEYGFYLAEFTQNPKPIKNPLGAARTTNGWDVHTVKRLLKPETSGGGERNCRLAVSPDREGTLRNPLGTAGDGRIESWLRHPTH